MESHGIHACMWSAVHVVAAESDSGRCHATLRHPQAAIVLGHAGGTTGKRLQEEWKLVLGEAALDIQPGNVSLTVGGTGALLRCRHLCVSHEQVYLPTHKNHPLAFTRPVTTLC